MLEETTEVTDLGLIGRGGYGEVFKARHHVYGLVVVKRPLFNAAQDDEAQAKQIQYLHKEAKIWKTLSHDNILKFLDVVQFDQGIGLMMEYANEGTLVPFLRAHPDTDRLIVILQISSGIEYLHAAGVVHGDIKASNILVSGEARIRISDFGLSKPVGTITTSSQKWVGSLRWLAPEIVKNECGRTFQSDVYAFGMVIYEVVTLRIPFHQRSEGFAVVAAILQNERPTRVLEEWPSGYPYGSLWHLAHCCWEVKASSRPDMETIRQKLDDLLAWPQRRRDITRALITVIGICILLLSLWYLLFPKAFQQLFHNLFLAVQLTLISLLFLTVLIAFCLILGQEPEKTEEPQETEKPQEPRRRKN